MKLTILQDDAIAEDEIIIRTATRHPRLERLIDLIKQYSITLKAYHNNKGLSQQSGILSSHRDYLLY